MASLTKIMTALLAIEDGQLDRKVTISHNAVNRKSDESTAWLEEGEVLTLRQLLYALLLRSANDAAVAIAEAVSGNEATFVQKMNERAKRLGLYATHFSNPHGYYGKNHYTNALDLAELTRYALTKPLFAQIVRTREVAIPWASSPYDRILRNHNKLLEKYPLADGVKTGYTRRAGHCLVASATKNGMQLIAVLLDSQSIYDDAIQLFNYGFSHFQRAVLIPAKTSVEEDRSPLLSPSRIRYLTAQPIVYVGKAGPPQDLHLKVQKKKRALPLHQGDPLGTLQVYWGGRLRRSIPLVAGESHRRSLVPLLPLVLAFLPAPLLLRRRSLRRQVKVRDI